MSCRIKRLFDFSYKFLRCDAEKDVYLLFSSQTIRRLSCCSIYYYYQLIIISIIIDTVSLSSFLTTTTNSLLLPPPDHCYTQYYYQHCHYYYHYRCLYINESAFYGLTHSMHTCEILLHRQNHSINFDCSAKQLGTENDKCVSYIQPRYFRLYRCDTCN